jgi:hypothetical protein
MTVSNINVVSESSVRTFHFVLFAYSDVLSTSNVQERAIERLQFIFDNKEKIRYTSLLEVLSFIDGSLVFSVSDDDYENKLRTNVVDVISPAAHDKELASVDKELASVDLSTFVIKCEISFRLLGVDNCLIERDDCSEIFINLFVKALNTYSRMDASVGDDVKVLGMKSVYFQSEYLDSKDNSQANVCLDVYSLASTSITADRSHEITSYLVAFTIENGILSEILSQDSNVRGLFYPIRGTLAISTNFTIVDDYVVETNKSTNVKELQFIFLGDWGKGGEAGE